MATVSTQADAVPSSFNWYATFVTVALGTFLFGFDTAVINGAVLALKSDFNTTSVGIGFSVSLALVGSAVGAFFAPPLIDRIGRIRCMLISSILFLVSAIGSGVSVDIVDFIFWRTLGGIGVGGASVHIATVSSAEIRGRLGYLQQLAIVVGIFVALLVNFALAGAAGSAQAPLWLGFEAWRWMFWSEAVPAIAYGFCSLLIPESPRYLVAQGRDAEAERLLASLGPLEARGRARDRVDEIRRTLSREHKPRLSDLRGKWGLMPIVWIGMGLSVFQQFVGINVIFYYGSALWRIVGFTEKNALISMMIIGATNIVATLVAIAFINKFGRKLPLLLGSLGMVVTLGIMAWIFGASPVNADGFPVLSHESGLVALIIANAYVFCFGFSWGPVVWVLLGEMLNNMMALALSVAVQWVANFIVSLTFPPIAYNLGLGVAYSLYAAFAALSLFFVIVFIRETKGKKLEDIDRVE